MRLRAADTMFEDKYWDWFIILWQVSAVYGNGGLASGTPPGHQPVPGRRTQVALELTQTPGSAQAGASWFSVVGKPAFHTCLGWV